MQAPLHSVVPETQPQTPLVHVAVLLAAPGHTFPQLPQLSTSEPVFVLHVSSPLQLMNPATHWGVHSPLVQTAVATLPPVGHVMPQPPQFWVSLPLMYVLQFVPSPGQFA
jgi:hypothetical protein